MKIPLFTQPDVPDAWHRVTAPGGYECWNFHAEDSASKLRLVVSFSQGSSEHPGYLRAYRQFRRWPTRRRPPVPAEYPCVAVAIFQNDQPLIRYSSQNPADLFAAATDRVDVRFGTNTVTTDADGSLRLQLRHGLISATFRFAPKLNPAPLEQPIFPRIWSGADHRWIIANPVCDVTGEIQIDPDSRAPMPFNGRGCHDHSFGLAPIGRGMDCWMRGQILMEDHTILFHYARPKTAGIEFQMIESEPMGTRVLAVEQLQFDWTGRTRTLLAYPAHINAGPFQLHSPRLLEATMYSAGVVYEATIRGVQAEAYCHIVYPHRLRWPCCGWARS